MKIIRLTGFLAGFCAIVATRAFGAGSEAIIKQHAKDLVNQNNVQQGVPPPVPPQPARPAGPAAPAQTPAQVSVSRVEADLAAFKANTPVTDAQKQQLASHLMAAALGTAKPSHQSLSKLADSLAPAVAGADKPLGAAERSRLVQDLSAILNGPNMPLIQVQAIAADIQAILQNAGLARKQAAPIGEQVLAISAEVQKAK